MSGRVRASRQTSSLDSSTLSINEKILRECHHIYTNDDNGLIKLANILDVKLLAPRKKINILLIGNHSAGKSSFINWYIEKHVQKEGVAIETQGITFVTYGKKRDTLTGNATLHLYPQFEPLRKVDGILQYLTTELCDSIAKRFPLVTFIDTPGLVDGNMSYAFDVNEVILWLGDMCDLIFVFFDPIGQALCKRTMSIVGKLGETHAERMQFYLSKADEAGEETDRQRVLMQITQEVCKYPSLNRTCFDIQTIYNPNRAKPTRCVNQIDEASKSIEKTIQMTIQNTLNALERDCGIMAATVERKLQEDEETKSLNLGARLRYCVVYLMAMLLPLSMLTGYLVQESSWPTVSRIIGKTASETVYPYLTPFGRVYGLIPEDYNLYAIGIVILGTLLLMLIAKFVGRTRPTLTRRQKKRMIDVREHVQELVKTKKHNLYQEYLKQSVKEQDF